MAMKPFYLDPVLVPEDDEESYIIKTDLFRALCSLDIGKNDLAILMYLVFKAEGAHQLYTKKYVELHTELNMRQQMFDRSWHRLLKKGYILENNFYFQLNLSKIEHEYHDRSVLIKELMRQSRANAFKDRTRKPSKAVNEAENNIYDVLDDIAKENKSNVNKSNVNKSNVNKSNVDTSTAIETSSDNYNILEDIDAAVKNNPVKPRKSKTNKSDKKSKDPAAEIFSRDEEVEMYGDLAKYYDDGENNIDDSADDSTNDSTDYSSNDSSDDNSDYNSSN